MDLRTFQISSELFGPAALMERCPVGCVVSGDGWYCCAPPPTPPTILSCFTALLSPFLFHEKRVMSVGSKCLLIVDALYIHGRGSPYSQRKKKGGGGRSLSSWTRWWGSSGLLHFCCCCLNHQRRRTLIVIRTCIYLEASKHAVVARNTRRRNLRLLQLCLIDDGWFFAILERSIVKITKHSSQSSYIFYSEAHERQCLSLFVVNEPKHTARHNVIIIKTLWEAPLTLLNVNFAKVLTNIINTEHHKTGKLTSKVNFSCLYVSSQNFCCVPFCLRSQIGPGRTDWSRLIGQRGSKHLEGKPMIFFSRTSCENCKISVSIHFS